VFRILITDASSKHCIPLQRHLRTQLSDITLVGHDDHFYPLCKHYGYLHRLIRRIPLAEAVRREPFDMVIPVGSPAVAAVARCCPELAALPSAASLACCLDKSAALALAERLGVPVPRTALVRSPDDLAQCTIGYPCAVKPVCEVEMKGVFYVHDDAQRLKVVSRLLARSPSPPGQGVLVQEYVAGVGVGFFALFDRGQPKRVFMHRRLREWPVSGGRSTAACAYYHETLKDYGLRILSALEWHGVAMVEFKHQEASDRLVLMEINPKFWGSVELALEAGVDFAADLVRVFRGEALTYSECYDRQLHFYWPLDGDLVHLVRIWQPGKVREYCAPHARTNLGYSHTADALKALRTCWQMVTA
jgi:predicted ATP-grasp superfamily ATP-dependent carboligase